MGILRRLFGKNDEARPQSAGTSPADDPNMIRVYDGYGREMFIDRRQWRSMLLSDLQEKRHDPDRLYGALVAALKDGFAKDVVPYAEHLHRTDPTPSRAATILGIAYMESNRLGDAERVLTECLSAHGEDGVVLTNLAKVHSLRGDDAHAEAVLWHALQVDPNQDNGLDWYAAIHRDRGGEAAALAAYRRVATLPGSWRTRLWLARDALEHDDIAAADALYGEVLAMGGRPVPADALTQISGDLGQHGRLAEVVRLVEPHFDPAVHGLQVGNNLIKAHRELDQLDVARRILDGLCAQKRPDWKEALSCWDTELSKAAVAQQPQLGAAPLALRLISVEGPVWTRDASPFAGLLSTKPDGAVRIVVFGNTVLRAETSPELRAQLSDAPGQASRAIPLLLAERIHLGTDGIGLALIPWMEAGGFVLFGQPSEDRCLCELAGRGEDPPAFVAGLTIDARRPRWRLELRLLRRSDATRLAEERVEMAMEDAAGAVARLTRAMGQMVLRHAGARRTPLPEWYRTPPGPDFVAYTVCLEQQLALVCTQLGPSGRKGIHGERDILDGALQLCVRQPANALARIVLARTLAQMRKVGPDILAEYREKIALLQRDHRLGGDVGRLIGEAIAGALADPP